MFWYNFCNGKGEGLSIWAPSYASASRLLPVDFGADSAVHGASTSYDSNPEYVDTIRSPWTHQAFSYYHHPNGGVVRVSSDRSQIIAGSPQGVIQEHTDLDEALKWVEENS